MSERLVVLIEDAEADAHSAKRMLARLFPDVELERHSSAEALVRQIEQADPAQWWPHLFIIDVNLTGMSGIELLRRLKQSPWRKVPAVVLSGSATPTEVQQCYDLGAAGYVTKPIGGDELTSVWTTLGRFWFEIAAPTEPPS